MSSNYFLSTIKHLFEQEEILLFQNLSKIRQQEKDKVRLFLQEIYELETLTFQFEVPDFNSDVALWAAEFMYVSAQLIIYRENHSNELQDILPNEEFVVTPSTLMSVDICFRFIPDLLKELKLIDGEDKLIPILESKLQKWYYSAVNSEVEIENKDWDVVIQSPCLTQLYINRIIKFKNRKLAKIPNVNSKISARIGIYDQEFWPDFKLIELDD